MARKHSALSKFISFPTALIAGAVFLIVLVVIGMQYVGVANDQLSAKLPPSDGLTSCVQKHNNCVNYIANAYDMCTKAAEKEMLTCLEKADVEKDAVLRRAYRAGCELAAAQKVNDCTQNNCPDTAVDVETAEKIDCAEVMSSCLEKYYAKAKITPLEPPIASPVVPPGDMPASVPPMTPIVSPSSMPSLVPPMVLPITPR